MTDTIVGAPPPKSPTAAPGPSGAAREDLEATTGSSTALLRTIVGAVLRPIGGWMSASGAVELLAALDIPASTARSSLARLCARGVLQREARGDVAGYAIDPAAIPMLERGDSRIFRRVDAGDTTTSSTPWCLVSFSLPERQRARRHQLRRRLSALGCGTVADGLWIAPAGLEAELVETIGELGLREQAVLFTSAVALGDLASALPRWYDLATIRAACDGFLAHHAHPLVDAADAVTGRDAFARWVRALDEYRVIPYLDPGLPVTALPADWPAPAAAATFGELRARLEPVAVAYAAAVATAQPPRADEHRASR
ncbi:PaaX family transcriptional regulator C-terminal domain-containing protein [Leifsonia sp. NPDC102414]|uniref:PaaX family transcriptional regulator n=1 Tax=Leifsonia sp. NPDC102414 TaxID=3364124 RepID=UPI0037FAE73F